MATELMIHECGCVDCQAGEHPAREDHRQFNLLLSRLDEQQRRWHLDEQRSDFRRSGDPRISVDTKKKELIGQFKNPGQTWRQEAEKVNDHDFPGDATGRAAPYGIYEPERNEGHVCVTTSSDTADLAVDAIEDWWRWNQAHYPNAKRLMIEADSGGSNGARSRRYKKRLQEFVDSSFWTGSYVPKHDPGTPIVE